MTGTTTRRAALAGATGALALPGLAARAQQQGERFPNRPITLIVPFPAGGTTDGPMRALAEAASRFFGQPVLVENRPGAGSTLGAAAVARARPDGHMVAQMTLPAMRLPFMQRMPYDPRRDFTPVIHLTGYLFGMVVRADSPFRAWADLVAAARARPNTVTVGNSGANGTPHLAVAELAERERIEVVHVPFRGEAEQMPALLGGHIMASTAGSGAGQLVDEGKLRWLNHWTAERTRRWPEVPTLLDLGYRGMVVTSPYGLVAPAGLEAGVLRTLHDGLKAALFDPQHQAALERYDMRTEYLNSADYARFMAETIDAEEKRVDRLGLRGT